MERFSSRESVLLGYSPSRSSFVEDPTGSSSKSSSSDTAAAVDFHDVFGGPPRRVSVQEGRYSYSESGGGVFGEGNRRGGSEEVARRNPWGGLGIGEKPVFGGEMSRKTSDDFFDDIFRGGGDSVGSTPKREVYSSSLPVRVKSFENLSLASQSQPSHATKLAKGMDVPVFTSVSHSPRRSRDNYFRSSTAPSSRLSRHESQGQEDLANEAQVFYSQSPLSIEFSFENDGSVKVMKNEKGGREEIVKQEKAIGESLINSGQFHFSIYKWASKGAPPMIPIRGGLNFRLKDERLEKVKPLNGNGRPNSDNTGERPAATDAGVGLASVNEKDVEDGKFSRTVVKERNPEMLSSVKTEDVLDENLHQVVEERSATPSLAEPIDISKYIVDDSNFQEIRARGRTHTVEDFTMLKDVVSETTLTEKENQKSDMNSLVQEMEELVENQTPEVAGKPKGTKMFSRFVNFGSYIKKQDGKVTVSDNNSDAEKTSVPSSPGENSRRRRVKEKVKGFVEMFNQDSSSKPKIDAEILNQKLEGKDKGKKTVEVGTTKTVKDLLKPRLDKKNESGNASPVVEKNLMSSMASNASDKKISSPKASAKVVKKIVTPKANKVTSGSADSDADRNITSQATPATELKESVVSMLGDKIAPPVNFKIASPKANKILFPNAEIVADKNINSQTEPKKETSENDATIDNKKISPPSTSNRVEKKIEHPNISLKVDGYRKQDKFLNFGKEPSPSVFNDVSSPRTGSVPGDYQDAPESLFDPLDAFEIEELTEEPNTSQADEYQQALQDSDAKIRQWSRGKEGNIRSLLSTLQLVLWPGSGWKPVALMDIIEANQVKRTYQRALLCLHPDKLQQKGAAEHQKYIAEKVFDILQESWNHFNTLTSL